MSRLKIPTDQPGALLLPEDTDEDYARQLVSETRIVVDKRPTWVKRQADNHLLDCEALAAAGAYSLNVHRIPADSERTGTAKAVPTPSAARAPGAAAAREERPGGAVPAPAVAKLASTPPPPPATATDLKSRFRKMGLRARR